MFPPYKAAKDIYVLPAYFPIPGLGIIPVNAFLLKSAEPVLIDTGLVPVRGEFMDKLYSLIDLAEIKWLWLTHCDQDHLGSLSRLLEAAPGMRIITTFLGVGKMSLFDPLPMERLYLLNPGQRMDVGDRELVAIKPPAYDAPETTGLYDPTLSALFSSDCFGALMSEPAESAAGMDYNGLCVGMLKWAAVDFPWLHVVDKALLNKALEQIRKLSPEHVLSSHLPAASGIAEKLLQCLADTPAQEPFVGPDQQAMQAMLKARG